MKKFFGFFLCACFLFCQTAVTESLSLNVPSNTGNNSLAVFVPARFAPEGSTATKDPIYPAMLYYIDQTGSIYASQQSEIFSADISGKKKKLLSSDEASNLNITPDGQWLYYVNWSDGRSIYKVSADPKEPQKIKISPDAASNLILTDDALVYTKLSTAKNTQNIYKMYLEDRTTVRLNEDTSDNLNIFDGWIYYANADDGYRIYKIRLDGSGRAKISEDQTLLMVLSEGVIYYSNYSDGQKLYKMDINGGNRTALTEKPVGFINVKGNIVYFTNTAENHSLYSLNTKNGFLKEVSDLGTIGPMPINIAGGYLYYNYLFLNI